MSPTYKKVFKYIFSVVLAAVLLYFSFRNVEWSSFWAALKSCRWGWVLASMLLGVYGFWMRGLRWRELLLPLDSSTSRLTSFNAVNIGTLFNLVLPRVGEVVRCGYITARSRRNDDGTRAATVDKVFGTVIVDRVWDLVFCGVSLLLVMVLMWERFGQFFSSLSGAGESSEGGIPWILLGGLATAGAVVLGVSYAFRDRPILGKVWGFVAGIWQGARSCLRMKGWWKVILYTAVLWSCYWMMSATIVWAVQGIDPAAVPQEFAGMLGTFAGLGLVDALFLMFAGSISTLLPVPGGFGAYHYVITLALSSLYGIPMELGIIYATLSHESQAVVQLLCGAGSYAWEALRS